LGLEEVRRYMHWFHAGVDLRLLRDVVEPFQASRSTGMKIFVTG